MSFAGFAIGTWAIGSIEVGVFATFTGLALTGIADFGGTISNRVVANGGATTVGIGLAALGTWASFQVVWLDFLVTVLTATCVVFSALLGGHAARGVNGILLFYLVSVGSAEPIRAIPDRIAGVALGGALVIIGTMTLWPSGHEAGIQRLVAAKLRSASDRLMVFATDVDVRAREADDGSSPTIRTVVDSLAARPRSPSSADRAILYLVNDIERLDHLFARLKCSETTEAERSLLALAAEQLMGAGNALSGEPIHISPSMDIKPVAPTPLSPYGLTARFVLVVDNVKRHVAVVIGQPITGIEGLDASVRSAVDHGLLRIGSNLTWRSERARDAMRVGCAVGAAIAVARVFGLEHGFWVALAVLSIVRSNAAGTGRRVNGALIGTALGFALSSALINAVGPRHFAYAILTPVAIFLAIYCNVAISFLAGQAAFTVAVIVLFSLLEPAGWRIGLVRLEDVAAGAAIGLAAGVFAWPKGATASINSAIAASLDSSVDYIVGTLRSIGHPGESTTQPCVGIDLSGLRRRATAISMLADDTFAEYLAEHPTSAAVESRLSCLSAANRLWYAADIIRADTSIRRSCSLDTLSDQLEQNHRERTVALRSVGALPVLRDGPRVSPYANDSLERWVEELAFQLGPTAEIIGGPNE